MRIEAAYIIIEDENGKQSKVSILDIPFTKKTKWGIKQGLQAYQDSENKSEFLEELYNELPF